MKFITDSITSMYEFTASSMREIDFAYDHNGLRTQKKIVENGVTTTYDYTLHGKLVTHMTKKVNGTLTDTLHFFYDAQSKPACVKWNDTMYRYIHNLQGDIVGILDANGNLVVEYKYDAWGKPISTTGSLKTSLSELNPFRYRSYIYNEESKLHYLQKRYYTSGIKRFVNADNLIARYKALLSGNTFYYCKNVTYHGIISDSPSGLIADLVIQDVYDFTEIWSGDSNKSQFAATVNDLGYFAQASGLGTPYEFEVHVILSLD